MRISNFKFQISNYLLIFLLLTAVCLPPAVSAQMSRKPSPSRNGTEGLKTNSAPRYLNAVRTQADFDRMARVYNAKTPYALPHAMFIIDRRDKNKIYYVNSQRYRFHQDFANAIYLSLKRGEEFFKDVYVNDNRRLIVGTIAWQAPVKKFTFEFWEGDMIPADLIKLTYNVINKTFFTDVAFKPNSIRHEDLSAELNIPEVTADEISKNQEYLALNTGKGVGRIHIIDKLDDTVEIGSNEIVVLTELPQDLPPVAGIIISKPSSPLSHVNLLAKGWNVPNAYIKDANELFRKYDGSWYEFETTLTDYTIKPCLKACLDEDEQQRMNRGTLLPKAPPSDLTVTKLASLNEMRKKDSIVYGSKSANLGEVIRLNKLKSFDVPGGFGIPFVYYKEFMEANGFDEVFETLRDNQDFVHNPSVRRKKLEEFRAMIQNGKFDEKLRAAIIEKWKTELGAQAVFVRSSSNAEDTGKFSGAGLYSSVGNVVSEEKLIEGVKKVWASIWNYAAYEARERNFVEHSQTYMAVLVQVGVKMDSGGVMITKDPYDKENKGAVYIASLFGHNQAVTNPAGDDPSKASEKIPIPEQILFTPRSNSVQILTRSDQETMFVPDENGGLKEVPFTSDRRVLSDAVARNLVKIADQIKRMFGGVEQDIEWGIMKGRVYIVQARPYIEVKR